MRGAEEALDLIRPLAASREIGLRVGAAHAEALWVTADQQRLKQVLLNLLSNAVKYNRHAGSVQVTRAASSPLRAG